MSKILGSHIPLQPKNMAINGALDIWQIPAGTTVNVSAASGSGWSADMLAYELGGATTKTFTLVRSTDVPTRAQSNFTASFSSLFTMTTGIVSPAASDYNCPFLYKMEGKDYQQIHGKTVTYGFWVKASIAGTYAFVLNNAAYTRSYATTFTINGANTWEFKAITVTMDTNASWVFTEASSLRVWIGCIAGSTNSTSTLNTWQGVGALSVTGVTNYQGTSGATLQVAMLSIVEGSLGLGQFGFQRQGSDVQAELALCQRYYEKSYDLANATGSASGDSETLFMITGAASSGTYRTYRTPFSVTKRAQPTMGFWDRSGSANGGFGAAGRLSEMGIGGTYLNHNIAPAAIFVGTTGFNIYHTSGNASYSGYACFWAADARL